MSKIKNVPAWAWRKTLYFVGAAVVAVLGAFGILSEVQVNEWTEQLDKILPYVIGVFIPLLAGSRTHPGSDSTATDADAEVASLLGSAHDVADIVVQQVKTVTPQDVASAVLAAIRAEERGEHFTATDPTAMVAAMKTEAARADYVYGR